MSPQLSRFDIVIYEIQTRKINAIVGRNLLKKEGEGKHNCVESRIDAVDQQIDLENFATAAIPANSKGIGDILTAEALV
jgi:hypothetical protein